MRCRVFRGANLIRAFGTELENLAGDEKRRSKQQFRDDESTDAPMRNISITQPLTGHAERTAHPVSMSRGLPETHAAGGPIGATIITE